MTAPCSAPLPRRRLRPMALRLALASAAVCASAAAQPPADLRERLAACAACHGERGEGVDGSIYYPHLAGKPAGYLVEQLQAFRDGHRHYWQMVWLAQYMDDAYIAEIAAYYAAQPPHTRAADVTAAPLPPAVQARAEHLVRHGDAQAGIPACTACHGAALTGLEPAVPALVGLPQDYIVSQIGSWRDGTRRSKAPDCMAGIAAKLAPADIRILAQWLSHQSPGAHDRPAPAGSFVPPLACGDLPHAEVQP
ncbi:c-type cytochrome [Dokdonella koreensis]|nr:c-type cytochrome [Dokdonella koreensis]